MRGKPESVIAWDALKTRSSLNIDLSSLPPRMAVAWSGGVDSSVLLFGLKSMGLDIMAWHIDHAWHPESDMLVSECAELADFHGIPFDYVRLSCPPLERNREGESRRLRYAAFGDLARKHHIKDVCLAHHADDQDETIVLRLLQGAGYRGLRGMASRREHEGMTLWRPLLKVRKSHLKDIAMQCCIPWQEDPSNQDLSLWRNKVRHSLIPAWQASGLSVDRLAAAVMAKANHAHLHIESILQQVPLQRSEQSVSVSWASWIDQSEPVRVALLQCMVRELFDASKVLGRRHIELVMRWANQKGQGGLDLSKSRLFRKRQNLCLEKRALPV